MTEPEPTDSGGSTDPDGRVDVEASPVESGDVDGDDPPEGVQSSAGDGAVDSGESVDEELIARVEDTAVPTIAREIATLELEIEGLQAELEARDAEIEELTSKLKRKQADFENYKKRMQRRQEEARQRATAGLLERFLSVRDNLQRAVEQDEDVDIHDGVESTLRQFDDVLQAEDVTSIEPDPGADVDPHRHEVLARVDADVPAGSVAGVHRPGYEMGESVLREAQVTVSDGSADPGDEEAEAGGDETDDERADTDDADEAEGAE